MKPLYLLIGLFILLSHSGCSSDTLEEPLPGNGGSSANTGVYHDYIRQHPYPKADNELFLNPPPLIVPECMREAKDLLQFALSRSADFKSEATMTSKAASWSMYNPHRALENGTWYWRFRSIAADGTAQPWSETYRFVITDDLPKFVTPAAEVFFDNLPVGHPRLYCFLDSKAEEARASLSKHPEYKALKSRAATALQQDFTDIASFYQDKENAINLDNYVNYLFQAYYLTQEETYSDKMLEILRQLVSRPPTKQELFASNFISSHIAAAYLRIYDALYDQLTAAERTVTEELLMDVSRLYYKAYVGSQENNLYDSHFWQQTMRTFFQTAYMLYDKAPYATEIRTILEYYYEIWTARAPGSGYNRDGVWHNSVTYFNTNVETLYYMPSLLSHLTRADFLQHPWYKAAGRAMTYTWPVGSRNCGFGDGNEDPGTPYRLRIAFADFIARNLNDDYARWYAGQCVTELRQDFLLRLERIVNAYTYDTEQPQDIERMIWYKDAGEAVMHSDLTHIDRNLSLAFRSSRYGCSQHTFANQNAFNVLYKGVDVFHNTGYYLKYASPHHIMSYRHTRAHNTLLVNGIGQSFTPEAYGNILRGISGDHISYCLGDASGAYRATCDLKVWLEHFKAAGITQTPDNGFGATPLTKYLRHVWMLHPDIIVIYDELEASEPVRWDWLLHSPTAFYIESDGFTLSTVNKEKGFTMQARLFSGKDFRTSQTDQFVVPPTDVPNPAYPNQWHLSATVKDSRANRFLFIMQVYDQGKSPTPVHNEGNNFNIGNWHIQAELNPDYQPSVTITHSTDPVVFSYGNGDVSLPDKEVYRRQHPFSSVLYDEYRGVPQLREDTNFLPKHTRAVGGE